MEEPAQLGPTWSNDYDQAQCPLDGCYEPVHLTRTASLPLLAGMSLNDLTNEPTAETWEVGCVAGHVFVLPEDDAEEVQRVDADAWRRIRASGLAWPS